MRVEKGHAAGNELNGTTTAADLGLGRMVSKKKDCIGKVMSMREGLTAPDRPTLVGFKPLDSSCSLNAGAHFIGVGRSVEAKNDEGYMTSVCYSPSLESSIGLGFIRHGPQRLGETVIATDLVRDKRIEVESVAHTLSTHKETAYVDDFGISPVATPGAVAIVREGCSIRVTQDLSLYHLLRAGNQPL